MALVANDPKAAKRVGIPQSVGEEFMKADKGRKFGSGGVMKERMKTAKIFEKAGEKELARHEREEDKGKEEDTPAVAKKEEAVLKRVGAPKSVREYERKEHAEMGMKRGGGVKKMAGGGMSRAMSRPVDETYKKGGSVGGSFRHAADGVASRGKTKGTMIKMASGGHVGSYRSAADGIASKGKTRGTMVKMNMGGKC